MDNTFNYAKEYTHIIGDIKFIFFVNNLQSLSSDVNSIISHSHMHNELIYIVNGSFEIRSDEDSIVFKSGDMALIPSNKFHCTIATETTHYFSIGYIAKKIKGKNGQTYADAFNSITGNKIRKVEGFDKFDCFNRIAFYQRCGYSDSDQLIISCLHEMMFLIKDILTEDIYKLNLKLPFDISSYRYAYIDQYINENYNKTPSLKELADLTFISPAQLQRIIKTVYHQSFGERILFYKTENAKRLLKNSNYSVEKIAGMVGYESSKSFFKAFKKTVGTSPGQYRKKHRNHDE